MPMNQLFRPAFQSAPVRRQSPQWSTLVRNLGSVCWVFAAFIALAALLMGYGQYRRMTTWTPAQGSVVHQEIYWDYSRNTKGGSSVVYGARFTFRYNLNGEERTGEADLGYRTGFRGWIEHEVRRLPVGTTREIRVNPLNPSVLSLASDFGTLSFAAAYFALALAMLAFGIGLVSRRGAELWSEADERRRSAMVSA